MVAFATSVEYQVRRDVPVGVTDARLDVMLEDASTIVRAEAPNIDAWIAAGNMDANVPVLVTVDMVAEAVRRRVADQPAGSTRQGTNGPFSDSTTLSASLPDDLFLTRAMRRRLGIGQRAFTVPMYVVPTP